MEDSSMFKTELEIKLIFDYFKEKKNIEKIQFKLIFDTEKDGFQV